MPKAGVVAFGFGVPSTLKSNRRIAWIAALKSLASLPVFTQLDVQFTPEWDRIVARCVETADNPPPTLRLAREAVAWAIDLGIEELWIACARPHAWRCNRDLRLAIKERKALIVVKVCEGVYELDEDYWWMPDSEQPRVRSREEWEKRERILHVMPVFLYKLATNLAP